MPGYEGLNMKERRLFEGAGYGPAALQVMCRAFDEAWAEIASRTTNQPSDIVIRAARLKLANIVLSLATEDANDAESLKIKALLAFSGVVIGRAC
jgi:hypothetical protein